tara:strand:+ start:215 stop:454 length:240 start_codon:yes stop_codon:yes gene_type:complete
MNYLEEMTILFSYVKYSEANFHMSSAYTVLLLVTLGSWILLWLGYRNNKINDENKEKLKQARIQEKIKRRKKMESLYPK